VSHFIGSASALGPPEVGDTSACESCLVFGHILYDAVGDPYVESKLVSGSLMVTAFSLFSSSSDTLTFSRPSAPLAHNPQNPKHNSPST
jgi:hypothetical protein